MLKPTFTNQRARWLSIAVAFACAAFSTYVYDTQVNPGHGINHALLMAGVAGLAASYWAWKVFPRMGNKWYIDLIWIAAAFPCVGGLTGAIISFGHPLGIWMGVMVSYSLPLMFAKVIVPTYAFGAVVAFLLPRTSQQML
ncbi:hypothetical protein J7400_12895 [Shimia sp. R9_2]|uniref:hypothetical protein n=1 Tax=Shimia sp. R9_2 TaxID=2821112 RepID=UPI001ADD1F05|nr:hypothetical protein [Shimia sp. R9_2]MBO9397578.1 hypothetical protein [Shimia sp. R9_2]